MASWDDMLPIVMWWNSKNGDFLMPIFLSSSIPTINRDMAMTFKRQYARSFRPKAPYFFKS